MKQRLVGTLVLGSLALILIPLLLDGEGVERPPLSANTPPAPIIDTTPLPEPTRPEIFGDRFATSVEIADDAPVIETDAEAEAPPAELAIADASEPVETVVKETPPAAAVTAATATPAPAAPQPAVAESASRSISAPALDVSGLPETWVVRVGVFGNAANASRLEERLKSDDYKAFARPLGVSTAVYVGPVATRDEAVAIQQRLNAAKASYQIDGVSVQRFDIGQQ